MVDEDLKEDVPEWEEKDVEDESGESEGFSIGDVKLSRGKAKEVWGQKLNLEEEVDDFEFDDSSGFEEEEDEEEFGEGEGFSYEGVGQGGGGDFYGVSGGGDFYSGVSGGSGLYSIPGKGSDSVSLYNTSGGSGESSFYNVGGKGKKDAMSSVYRVEGGRDKSGERRGGRRKAKSGLESGVVRKRGRRGVSII